jgi:hypothetical protein
MEAAAFVASGACALTWRAGSLRAPTWRRRLPPEVAAVAGRPLGDADAVLCCARRGRVAGLAASAAG